MAMKTSKSGRLGKLIGMGVQIVGKSVSGALMAKEELDVRVAQARALVQTLSELKGASMKIGQMLSIQGEHFLPKEVTDILATLQNAAPAFSSDEILQIIRSEIGPRFDIEVEYFDPKSLAAASIGQVHKVKLKSGEWAVIKVQYPGIANAIDSEVDLLQRILTPISKLYGDQINLDDIVTEVKTLLKQEVDYTIEADFIEKFGVLLKDDERYAVPRVYRSLSSKKVITMTFEEGVQLRDVISMGLPQQERNKFGLWIYDLLLREVFEFNTVQTDPNFANFLFRVEDGRAKQIVLLDFGATKVFSSDFMAKYKKFAAAVFLNDRSDALRLADNIGFLRQDESEEAKNIFYDLTRMTVEPAEFDNEFDFGSSDLPKRIVGQIWPLKKAVKKTPVPTIVIFLDRKLAGVYNICRSLDAKLNVHKIFKKFVGITS